MYPRTLIKIPCLPLFPLKLLQMSISSAFLASILSYLTRVNIEMTFFFLSILEFYYYFRVTRNGWVREPFSLLILTVYVSLSSLCQQLEPEHVNLGLKNPQLAV